MSIIVVDDASFAVASSPRWIPDAGGLDRLIVPMQGAASLLDAYLATLTQWQASGIDGNMFLESWPNDGDRTWPTVDLTYIGKKGGVLPLSRTTRGSNLGTVSRSGLSIGPVQFTIAWVYSAPTETVVSFSRSKITRPTAGRTLPGSAATLYGISIVKPLAGTLLDGPIVNILLAQLVIQEAIADFQSDEVVHGQYWQNRVTTTWTLI